MRNAITDSRQAQGESAVRSQISVEDIISRIEQEHRSFKGQFPMFAFSERQLARIQHQIDEIVSTNVALPNGKGRSSKLNPNEVEQLKLDLLVAAGFAASLVTKGQLKNRIRRPGRPPDNATFIFIDDLMQACRKAGLKPGLRFVTCSQSLPVRLYVALAPTLGFGNPKNPRRLFDRWQRLRPTLIRR